MWSSVAQHTSEKGQCLQMERSYVMGHNSVKGRSSAKGRNRKPARFLLLTRIHPALTSGSCIPEAEQVGLAWAVDILGLGQKPEHQEQQGGSSEERRLPLLAGHWAEEAEQKCCCSGRAAQAGAARRARAAFCTCSTT